MTAHTIRVGPVYNFRTVNRAEKRAPGARSPPGGSRKRGARSATHAAGGEAHPTGLALPGAPSGGGGAGGRRGEPHGKQSTRQAAQRSRVGPASTNKPRPPEGEKRPTGRTGGRGGAKRGRSPEGPSEAPHGPTRCTRAKHEHSKGDRTGSPQRREGGPAGRRRQRVPAERDSAHKRPSGGAGGAAQDARGAGAARRSGRSHAKRGECRTRSAQKARPTAKPTRRDEREAGQPRTTTCAEGAQRPGASGTGGSPLWAPGPRAAALSMNGVGAAGSM